MLPSVRANRRAIELWGRAPSLNDRAQRFCACFRVDGRCAGDVLRAAFDKPLPITYAGRIGGEEELLDELVDRGAGPHHLDFGVEVGP